jgi:anti-sigma factor RsiW
VNCQENELLIHAYLDGELDLLNTLELEAHVRECAACAEASENNQMLRSAITKGSFYFKAPTGLAERVHTALQEADQGGSHTSASVQESAREMPSKQLQKGMRWQFSWAWVGLAAAAAMAALVVWRFDPAVSRPSQGDLLAQEVLASHVRSLMADHLTDVPSSDQHTVKPWFNGKLDFSPPVMYLSGAGFPLVGGRLDYVEDRPVAALVYQRRKHFINLFIWPSYSGSGPRTVMRQGYNLLHWAQNGMAYWAVSDLNCIELKEFIHLVENHPTYPLRTK